jgi:hypothetical protein
MVKYYGAAGNRVGEYRSAKLGASFSQEEFVERWGQQPVIVSPAKDMDKYLSRAGAFIGFENKYDAKHVHETYAYHYAGATVLMRFNYLENPPEEWDIANLTLRLTSNDSLDNVIENLMRKFPYLQKDKSFDDLGWVESKEDSFGR